MKNMMILGVGLLLLAAASLTAQTVDDIEKYSLWIGGHHTNFDDYNKKVGEYRLFTENFYVAGGLDYLSARPNSIFRFSGLYYDNENPANNGMVIVEQAFVYLPFVVASGGE